MRSTDQGFKFQQGLVTVLTGAAGAFLGYLVSLPLYPIIGAAVLVSLLSFTAMRFTIDNRVRDIAFVFLGINIGSGVDPSSLSSMLSWPVAFVLLIVSLVVIILAGMLMLSSFFKLDRRSSILSSSPGHLSYILGLAVAHKSDATRISILQSIRLMLLTLSVPFIAKGFGFSIGENIMPTGISLSYVHLLVLIALSGLLGVILMLLKVPAAFLLGGMAVSSFGHVTDWTPGTLPAWIAISSFIVLGSLIGSRFSGLSLKDVGRLSFAGTTLTAVTIMISMAFAVLASHWIGIPLLHTLFAFAPGGMETMIIMGAIVGVDPAFLAACHVTRLFSLSLIVPIMLSGGTKLGSTK